MQCFNMTKEELSIVLCTVFLEFELEVINLIMGKYNHMDHCLLRSNQSDLHLILIEDLHVLYGS